MPVHMGCWLRGCSEHALRWPDVGACCVPLTSHSLQVSGLKKPTLRSNANSIDERDGGEDRVAMDRIWCCRLPTGSLRLGR